MRGYFERQVELLETALTGLLEAKGKAPVPGEMLKLLELTWDELDIRFRMMRHEISLHAWDAWHALRDYESAAAGLRAWLARAV